MPIKELSSAGAAKGEVTGRLIAAFKQLISEGTLVPGCKLPPERELSENFGVARSSLRQALKILENIGVISQRVGDGTYLNGAAPAILEEPMNFLILLDGISAHELIEARLIVEPELAARAAERASKGDIADLRAALAATVASRADRDEYIRQDLVFHQTIFRSAGNRVCSLMFTVIHRSMLDSIGVTSGMVTPEHTHNMHKRIFSAIQRKDPEAARRRMTEHLEDARNLLASAAKERLQHKVQDRICALTVDARPSPAKKKG